MKWTLLVSVLTAGTLAHAAGTKSENLDLSAMSQSPLPMIEMLDANGPHPMPQACTDAKITPEQHTAIVEAVYQSERTRVKAESDLKLAFMDYMHTIFDDKSDAAAAEKSGALITDGVSKMTANKLALTSTILYTILTPEQRMKGAECLMILEKAAMHKKLERICKSMPTQPAKP